MSKGSWAATASASTLIAADPDRAELIIQHQSGSPVFLAFGADTPVVDEGVRLHTGEPTIIIDDYRKGLAVTGICDTALSASGGYQGA